LAARNRSAAAPRLTRSAPVSPDNRSGDPESSELVAGRAESGEQTG
jgi:hypothetical protein